MRSKFVTLAMYSSRFMGSFCNSSLDTLGVLPSRQYLSQFRQLTHRASRLGAHGGEALPEGWERVDDGEEVGETRDAGAGEDREDAGTEPLVGALEHYLTSQWFDID